MDVRASWVAGDQLAELEVVGELSTAEEVRAFDAEVRRALEGIMAQRKRRFPVLIGVSDLVVHPDRAEAFGKVMADVREKYSNVMARWGSGLVTRQIIAVESMKVRHAANLFETRQDAIDFLRKVQRGEILASHRSSVPPRPSSAPPDERE